MEKETILAAINQYIESIFRSDVTGHDANHMKRVAHIARTIAIEEKADVFMTEAAALLHDIGDLKLCVNPEQSIQEMEDFLLSIGLSTNHVQLLREIISAISFSKGTIPMSLEGKIVQDADRIDAIGAIGIARTFAYGGASGQQIYHHLDRQTSIQHFYDKLLKLKDTLHTDKAKEIAEKRHQFLLTFLNQFWDEWQA